MPLSYAVKAHPNAVCSRIYKRTLGVCGDCAGVKANLFCQVNQIVNPFALVFPYKGFSSLKIDKPASQRVTILQFFANLLKSLDVGIVIIIDAAMLTLQVAFVRYEDDALKRLLLSEKPRLDKPLCQVT